MKHKIYCEVCRVEFIYREAVEKGTVLICPVCGAGLEITAVEPEIKARRYPREPEAEIRERVETFARLRGYVFNENKEPVIEGLIEKNRRFGDFYCPCRFDNVPENVCPCRETRMNRVRKEGSCF